MPPRTSIPAAYRRIAEPALRHRLQHIHAEEGPQGLRNHDRAGGGQGAVERGRDPRALVGVAVAHGEAASLEGGAVRGGGELAVDLLGGQPALAVELAGGAGAEVTG